MRTFAIVNQKGGCGKTTTAINLSAVFAHRGLRTLLVDMDPQAHCATGLGVPEHGIDTSIAEALLQADSEAFDPTSAVWEVGGNLDLLPSTMRLFGMEAPGGGLHELPDRDRRLATLLGRLAARYDRCLIDCPPTIGLLTFNALRAAREALVPVETGYFALRGAEKQWRTIRQLIERIGRPIACHLVPTLYDAESALATNILAALRRQFAGQVIPVVVHEDEVVREAASLGQPVIEYAADSTAREDFERLADWLEDHPPHPGVQIEVGRGQVGPPEGHPGGLVATPSESPGPGLGSAHSRAAELARRVRELRSRVNGVETPGAGLEPHEADGAEQETGVPAVVTREPTGPAPEPHGPPIAAQSADDKPAPPYGASATGRGVRFVQPGDGGHLISVAGDFNHWSPTATPLTYDASVGAHQTLIEIPPGRYRYRLVVDGRWQADPYNGLRQVNKYDELNSVLVVPERQEAP